MKKALFILFLLVVVSCNKDNKKVVRVQKSDIKKYEPIFLSLSPRMPFQIFDEEIQKLNSKGLLTEGKFPLVINDQEFLFSIQKYGDGILLESTNEELVAKSKNVKVGHQNYVEYKKKYENILKKMLNQFSEKYVSSPLQIPNNLDLNDNVDGIDFMTVKYSLFKDDKKNILIGYQLILPFDPAEYNQSDTPMARVAKATGGNESSYFGLKISIYYYYKEDFDKLLDKLKDVSEFKRKKDSLNKMVMKDRKEDNINKF